ncbi:MAG: hypothetical protein MJE77_01690 [Proteobacteria bacterium]|nr:hypothetical protein [Pseudomonadota bacterium]
MVALARQQASNCSHPVLDVFTPVDGFLVDVELLEFVILDKTGPSPVQVFPAAGREAVDTTQLCPTGGNLSTGHYVATYAVPADANVGTHAIQWFVRVTAGAAERTFSEEFDVVAAPVEANSGYCRIQEIRDEGVSVTAASDERLARLIALSSRYIEAVTDRFFEPRALTIHVDGRDSHDLLLETPIVAVAQLEIVEQGLLGSPFTGRVSPSNYRVYNRHLTQGLVKPDDRENPKISFLRDALVSRPLLGLTQFFPRGTQNIRVTGVFGYTDPGENPAGETPVLIREVCKRLVLRQLPALTDASAREDSEKRYRLIEEKSRFQSYKLGPLQLAGALTGDPEIDNILIQFKRPVDLGAA